MVTMSQLFGAVGEEQAAAASVATASTTRTIRERAIGRPLEGGPGIRPRSRICQRRNPATPVLCQLWHPTPRRKVGRIPRSGAGPAGADSAVTLSPVPMRLQRCAFVLAALAAAACAPKLKHIPAEVSARGVDLRPFAAQGFLFSPNAYPGAFDPVGLVTVAVYSEGTKATGPKTRDNPFPIERWTFTDVGATEGLDAARKQASALGADAIVNLVIRPVSRSLLDGASSVSVPGVEVTGFAIKRRP